MGLENEEVRVIQGHGVVEAEVPVQWGSGVGTMLTGPLRKAACSSRERSIQVLLPLYS